MERILITGSSGYIGSKLVNALAKNGQIKAIVGLDRVPVENPPDKLHFVQQDIREPVAHLLSEFQVDTVVHTAYILPPMHDRSEMEDINLNGTRNIVNACLQAGVKHLIYTSSATAYGFHPDNPVPMTEDQPLRGNDDFTYAKNKKEIELILQDLTREHSEEIGLTVLRPCFVIGPGIDNPVSRYLQKKIVILPAQHAPLQFVHENDLLDILLMCLERPVYGTYNVGGDGTISFPEMVKILGKKSIFLPTELVRPLIGLAWNLRLKFLTEIPTAGLNMIRFPWISSTEKLESETGFQFRYSSRQAFEDFAGAKSTRHHQTEDTL